MRRAKIASLSRERRERKNAATRTGGSRGRRASPPIEHANRNQRIGENDGKQWSMRSLPHQNAWSKRSRWCTIAPSVWSLFGRTIILIRLSRVSSCIDNRRRHTPATATSLMFVLVDYRRKAAHVRTRTRTRPSGSASALDGRMQRCTATRSTCGPRHAQSRLPYVAIFSILANSHSRLHNGQTDRVFSQRLMQSK